MDIYLGEEFHVEMDNPIGLFAFNGVFKKIIDDFYLFDTKNGPIFINKNHIVSMRPLQNKEAL